MDIEDIKWMPKGRYKIMRDYLPQRGKLAHYMMKGTTSVQCNYDFEHEEDCSKKYNFVLDGTNNNCYFCKFLPYIKISLRLIFPFAVTFGPRQIPIAVVFLRVFEMIINMKSGWGLFVGCSNDVYS